MKHFKTVHFIYELILLLMFALILLVNKELDVRILCFVGICVTIVHFLIPNEEVF
jgi:hypothetical protein